MPVGITAVVSLSESREPNESFVVEFSVELAELEKDVVAGEAILELISILVVEGGRSGLLLAIVSLVGEAA